ncbi:four helix bundle protein [Chryseobacterium sp.]|uniref:four helix bundle protein n=1 Tax=Chryseobacterium sp. TaxID=1871047 RepID=UPI0011C9176A|nr:four helix bundle protein [Chryseobacterium sp.]TXF79533.1 four helix bundle protein [Chryseobacterium sp.]
MQKNNLIKDKTFSFALMIIELYKTCRLQNEYVLSKQLLRSGTSIGANVQEAIAGFSQKDFLYKMSVASKEARETQYWVELLSRSGIVKFDEQQYKNEIDSIVKILTSIVKTLQEKQNTAIQNPSSKI